MELEPETIIPEGYSYFSENLYDDPDLPPEYCHYQDEGCEFADSCLNCPFARCIYDEPGGKQHFIKRLRNQEILRLYTDGKEIEELAATFGISQRTVQRALKREKQ
jgi:AraC-like DNA-binding protein